MKFVRIPLMIAAVAFASASANADILKLPNGAYGVTQSTSSVPRGISKNEVLKKLGEPQQRYRPVGVPAISSWEYGGFRVYFEDGLVLHTVVSVPSSR